jgi:hypothetical protein
VVGDKLDPVAHRCAHAAVHGVVGGVRWQVQQPADGSACEPIDSRAVYRRSVRYCGHLTKATQLAANAGEADVRAFIAPVECGCAEGAIDPELQPE